MTKDAAFPRRVYRLTTIGWFVMVQIHLGVYLTAFLRAGPTDEVYANSISFQILTFCLTVLPYWLLLLLTVLIIEFATVGDCASRSNRQHEQGGIDRRAALRPFFTWGAVML